MGGEAEEVSLLPIITTIIMVDIITIGTARHGASAPEFSVRDL